MTRLPMRLASHGATAMHSAGSRKRRPSSCPRRRNSGLIGASNVTRTHLMDRSSRSYRGPSRRRRRRPPAPQAQPAGSRTPSMFSNRRRLFPWEAASLDCVVAQERSHGRLRIIASNKETKHDRCGGWATAPLNLHAGITTSALACASTSSGGSRTAALPTVSSTRCGRRTKATVPCRRSRISSTIALLAPESAVS